MDDDKLSLWGRFQKGFQILKKPFVYLLVGVVVVLEMVPTGLLPWNTGLYLYGGALIGLLYMILEMLFEIYEKVLTERKELNIIDADKVYDEIKDIILGSKSKRADIQCIGVAGRNGWTNVIEKLTQENNDSYLVKKSIEFKIDIALLDKDIWEQHSNAFRRIDNYSKTIENIQRRSKYLESVVKDGSYLKLHTYNHLPNMIGLLVNENYLFVTNSYWEKQEGEWTLRAGGTNYFVYDKNDDFGGQEVINRFLGWFNYIAAPDSEKNL